MFWRAARGRVGPNSRAGLHMAIFLLNPYGLYACILIPKWLASSPEMSGFASYRPAVGSLPQAGRICQSVLDFQSVYQRGTSSSGHHMALHPTFLTLASLARKLAYECLELEHYMPIGARFARVKRRSKCGNLTFIEKYGIIFKKRIYVRRWRLGDLTILKKYDIINKKTSTADRHQCDRIWFDFYNFL